MLDNAAEEKPDRRPAMLVCVYGDTDALWPLDTPVSASARLVPMGPNDPVVLAEMVTTELSSSACRAVLLIGRTKMADRFRVQLRSENRSLTGKKKLVLTGPSVARATAPASEMVRAISDAGFAAEATSDSEDDAGSYLLYRILTALPDHADAIPVGLLRVPENLTAENAKRGVEAAALTMARHLLPLPRAQLS